MNYDGAEIENKKEKKRATGFVKQRLSKTLLQERTKR